jgi:hypothetical protein
MHFNDMVHWMWIDILHNLQNQTILDLWYRTGSGFKLLFSADVWLAPHTQPRQEM